MTKKGTTMKAQIILPSLIVASAALMGCQTAPFSLNFNQTGSLQVTVQGAQRTTQAKLSEIAHLNIQVVTQDATESQTVNAAALVGGNSAAVTFVALKPCTATVSVEAFSATESIGSATASALIQPLQITNATINLTLIPTYIQTGNLNLGISIQEGTVVRVTPAPEG